VLLESVVQTTAMDQPAILVGQNLSHYEVISILGEGGMGVVYKARDKELGRYVAIKVLPAHLVSDPERKKRFVQEARAASALNHPNIVTIHEIAHDKDMDFIVMEQVAGKTLDELIPRKGMRLKEALSVATQITDALAAAHAVGIIHRDLKPGNIMVTESGQAKVLDFGLAKLTDRSEGSESEETQTLLSGRSPKTEEGVVLGTVSYMSPEQAEGNPVDARSDIFSFGSVLYELLAGQRPFTGKSDLLILQAILHSPPRPLSEIRSDAPYELLLVVGKALEKDLADRYQSMREMVIDLKRVQRLKTSELKIVAPRPATRRYIWIPMWIGVLLLLALAASIWLSRRSDSWENPLANAQLTRFTDFEGAELDAAISADGKFVGFLADRDGLMDAWVSQVGTGQFLNLTKGRFPDLLHEEVRSIGFSSDASQVWLRDQAYRLDKPRPAAISLVPTMGGTPRKFLESGVEAAWSPDGTKIVYHEPGAGDPMFITDRNGSNRRQLFAERPGGHCHHQVWSPDGLFIYFTRGEPAINAADIWRILADGGQPERITPHNSRVAYPALIDGRTLLYLATAEDGSGPWLYSIDLERRVPHRVSFGLEQYLSLSSSADGRRLVAAVANPIANLWTVPISDQTAKESSATRLSLPTVRSIAPGYGPDFDVYLSSRGGPDGVWKFQDGVATELWKGSEGAVMAAPAVSGGVQL
jgi:eukaryotic-like serine/threonine-protein kinase